MLLNHLDEKTQLQIVGLEPNYIAAMAQLDSYYSDAKKVIRSCLDAWAVPGFSIGEGRILRRLGMIAKMWPYLL